jgi:hypothetical protein
MGGHPDCLDEGVRTARRPINHLLTFVHIVRAWLPYGSLRLAAGRSTVVLTVLWMLVIARPWLRGGAEVFQAAGRSKSARARTVVCG